MLKSQSLSTFLSKALEKFPKVTEGKSSNPPRAENDGEKRPIDVKASSSVPKLADRQ